MDKEQVVLSWLQDEESRFVFEKRLAYNKTRDFAYIREIVEKYLPQFVERNYYPGKEQELKKILMDEKKIILFGAGARLHEVCNIWKNDKHPFSIATDNNAALWGTQDNGIDIVAPDSVEWKNVDMVVITPFKQEIVEAVYKQILGYGVKKENILFYNDYISKADEELQYFNPEIIKWREEELFVDGGALDLSTSIRFAKRCKMAGGKGKVLAFEPDEVLYERSKRILNANEDLRGEVHNAGLWSLDTILYFNMTHGGDGRIVDKETDTRVNVVALDDYIDKNITFIKMDIEGSELEALKGSREVIKKYRPKLAISVYHKPEDIITLPMYIKELVPEYKLYMRHYSDGLAETVLYAVME